MADHFGRIVGSVTAASRATRCSPQFLYVPANYVHRVPSALIDASATEIETTIAPTQVTAATSENLEHLARLLDTGIVNVPIHQAYPLEQAPAR